MPNSIPPSLRSWLEDARDWSQTELGPIDGWPPDLTAAVAACAPLGPIAILWGPRFLRVYGPEYAPVLGDRHPEALGTSVAETWSAETWAFVEPYLRQVVSTGDVVTVDMSVNEDRSGFVERVHLRATYAPVRAHDSGAVLGVAATARDRNADVLGALRSDALARLGLVSVENRSPRSVAERVCQAILGPVSDVTAAAVVLYPQVGRGKSKAKAPAPTVVSAAEGPAEDLAVLEAHVRDCVGRGRIQTARGCRFQTIDQGPPTPEDVGQRAIGLWPDGQQAAGECRKLPGKGHLDDIGRLVVALDPLTKQDDQQHLFLSKATDLAARALRDSRAETSGRSTIEGLNVALDSNRTIGAAMGVLIALRHVTPNEAFELLRAASQNSNRKLIDIADEVLLTGTVPAEGE